MKQNTYCLLTLLLVGCANDPRVRLDVLLLTDYRPGIDFVEVRAEVLEETSSTRVVSDVESFLNPSDAARLEGLTPAQRRRLRVELVRRDGTVLQRSRTVSFSHERDRQQLTRICAACEEFACPFGQTCECGVEPICVPEECTEEECETTTSCGADTECRGSGLSCVDEVCREGVCLRAPDDAVCATATVCDVVGGECISDPRPAVDAGSELGSPLAVGDQHSCAIFGDELACWGANDRGQLVNDDAGRLAPTTIPMATTPVVVTTGAYSTCVLDDVGDVRCVGANDRGQLGIGDVGDRRALSSVTLPLAARALSAGAAHVCTLLVDDRMFCWGRNDEGQLGIEPIDFGDQRSPLAVATDAAWETVSSGQGHTLAVTRQGQLLGWGRNTEDQLGLGSGAPMQHRTPTQVGDARWLDVAAGQRHSCALAADRTVLCFGSNGSAQLGLGDLGDRASPTPLSIADASAVATNTFHGCAIAGGELHCWGRNVEGQLGTSDFDDRLVPTRVGTDSDWSHVATGRFFTCARKRDGRVFCTGANEAGQLGTGDTERRSELTPVAR